MTVALTIARKNLLLNQLSDEELQLLLPQLQIVEHARKDMVYRQYTELEAVYFPCNAIFSSIIPLDDGTAIEVGMVGNEGFTGMELLLGATRASETRLCRVSGQSLRMAVTDFRAAIKIQARFHQIVQRASQAYLFQILQDGACHHWHDLEGRFARLLLETHDRTGQDNFFMTQEFAVGLLGIEQAKVSQVASQFQLAGLIGYRRENLEVLDRECLEEAACECYAKIRRNTQRLIAVPVGL